MRYSRSSSFTVGTTTIQNWEQFDGTPEEVVHVWKAVETASAEVISSSAGYEGERPEVRDRALPSRQPASGRGNRRQTYPRLCDVLPGSLVNQFAIYNVYTVPDLLTLTPRDLDNMGLILEEVNIIESRLDDAGIPHCIWSDSPIWLGNPRTRNRRRRER